mgnify:CR=1 FL=1
MADYSATRDRVEDYFDRSATKVWERLTSDAPVSRIRQTVREGRDQMRALMLSRCDSTSSRSIAPTTVRMFVMQRFWMARRRFSTS